MDQQVAGHQYFPLLACDFGHRLIATSAAEDAGRGGNVRLDRSLCPLGNLCAQRSALHEARVALCQLSTAQNPIFIRGALPLSHLNGLLFCDFVLDQEHSRPHDPLLPLRGLEM